MTDILNEEEVASILNCAVTTVTEQARTNQLPAIKFGKSWMFPKDALVQHLNTIALRNLDKETPAVPAITIRVPAKKLPKLPSFNW